MSKFNNLCNVSIKLEDNKFEIYSISGNSVLFNFAETLFSTINSDENILNHYIDKVNIKNDWVSLTISYSDDCAKMNIEDYAFLILRDENV